jgi:hypothetical protein
MTLQMTAQHLQRQQSFTRQIARLERRLGRLQTLERRFSWYRLAAFLAGLAAVWFAAADLSAATARLVFLAAGLLFAGIVFLHRRVDGWIARFQISVDNRKTQLARLELDWARIPLSPGTPTRSSLDIDLDLSGPRSLHHLIDLAVSLEGSACLRRWLTHPEPAADQASARQQVVAELAGLPRFRDRLLLTLRLASKDLLHGERLLAWLDAPYPARRLRWLLLIGSLFAATNLALFWLNIAGFVPAYWPLTLLLYFIFYNFNAPFLRAFLESVVDLDNELAKFRLLLSHLETYPVGARPGLLRLLAPFRDPQELPSRLVRRIKWVTAGVGLRSNLILGLLLNMAVPWDYLFALLAGRLRRDAGRLLPGWWDAWCDLEALSSLANFAYLNPAYAFPQIDADEIRPMDARPVFAAHNLGHPLIPAGRRVGNNFSIPETGAVFIITGSNMAGKSTFLKAIGINLCLAWSGGPVCAEGLRLIPFRLASCIQITDSLADGLSYFYAEVKCLKSLLDALQADDAAPLLYLIDELFRGTNNRERLIGSRAYTRALIGAHGAGLIATHDLELASLADGDPRVNNFHFRDLVEDQRLVFDFRLHPGPCPSTNALRIMEMEGLPGENVEQQDNHGFPHKSNH